MPTKTLHALIFVSKMTKQTHSRITAMAQLQRTRRSSSHSPKTHRNQTSPTFEQLMRVEDTYWSPIASPSASPTLGMSHRHDVQEDHVSPTHNKKSVLTKVKERAKKLRQSLSGRKKNGNEHTDDIITPPSMGITSMDNDNDDHDELDEDPEYFGAPMYESEAAPDTYKETARQHPRAVPVVSEKHVLAGSIKCEEAAQENDKPISPNMTITEKLAPAYAAVSDATHKITSKIAGLTITSPQAQNNTQTTIPTRMKTDEPQKWDKGVSVKEYFMNKLEPGDDERALSQAITEAISPTKTSGDSGVVERVKDAVTSFFWHEEPTTNSSSNIPSYTQQNNISSINAPSPKVSYSGSANSSPLIPVSTNVHEVIEEENHGKILQAN
ncbi:hypothetical protein BUALT_Bualt02G0069100 [Buddleja alternifolia]|uniref:Uncharacterized protein n=1 Tax=Buddleja alternifolia TaxID=168488 RepID=A0AAV6XY65_9LAMI|nr:hypothetical protein BUALT_Bualt02G0069100 [Buddleja alternifolia]